jgi:hypothetical protein
MSDWNEDNFLDKLSDLTGKNASRERCAEAENLSARADSEDAAEIADKIREHKRTCAICSDLRERLSKFDEDDVAGRETGRAGAEERMDEEGAAAEERLDAWFKEFLSARKRK